MEKTDSQWSTVLERVMVILPVNVDLSDYLPMFEIPDQKPESVVVRQDRPDQDSCTGVAVFSIYDGLDVHLDFSGISIGDNVYVYPKDLKYKEVYYR